MTDLARLLKAATPDPPVDVSVDEIAAHRRRRRTLAPLATAAVVLVVAIGAALVVRDGTADPAAGGVVTSDINGLHVPHPVGWAILTASPASHGPSSWYLTNAVSTGCTSIGQRACNPTGALRADQVVVAVGSDLVHNDVTDPNRVVAGQPARVDAVDARGCPGPAQIRARALLARYTIVVCGGSGVDAAAILDGVYLARPAPKSLGIVSGRSMIAGGAPPGLLRANPGIVHVGSYQVKTDAEGRFAIVVPEGTYRVDDGGCPGGTATVEVTRQRVSTANLTCQAK